jgi:TonB family protein
MCRISIAVYLLIAALVFCPPFSIGQPSEPDGSRKVLSRVMPVYPELARRTNVTGTVKLDALIAPDGKVAATEVVGGNPILIQCAVDAVRKWRFEASAQQTKQRIELKFNPH